MIYRCPNCNGALEYNPVSDKMECAHCGGGFTMQEMEADKQREYDYAVVKDASVLDEQPDNTTTDDADEAEHNIYASKDTMDCKIYSCTSCGAELVVSDTEISTWCAYCGQPTIVYNRVSEELKPDYIIPFKITREQAINDIRKKIRRGIFLPKSVKHFEIEKVRGIYLPYFLFDVHYRNNQKLYIGENVKETGVKVILRGYWLTAECEFEKLCCDASSYVSDELSQRLEPFDYSELKDFHTAYLSGFYAERNNMSEKDLMDVVHKRCGEMYDAGVDKELHAFLGYHRDVRITHPKCRVLNADYVLLPVWFLTFRYRNQPYTIVMNGQSGKVIGTSPFDRKKVLLCLLFIYAVLGLFVLVMYIFDQMLVFMPLFPYYSTAPIVMLLFGFISFSQYRKSLLRTKLKQTEMFVKDRQESDEWRY